MASGPERTRIADLSAGALMASTATRLTDAGSETARLDAELLVSHAFARDRTWLLASDLSPDALELASENCAAHGVAQLVTVQVSDLLGEDGATSAEQSLRADLVTANLPYVTSAEVSAARGSLAFEPRLALDG